MADMPRAVISSTTRDLPAHRDAAMDACLRQGFFPLMMEHETLSPATAAQVSRNLVDRADVYILILGFRYGAVGPGQVKSYTHLELDRAIERGIPKLVLLMADDHPLTQADVDIGPAGERVRALREHLSMRQVVGSFSSAEQMRAMLIDGLSTIKGQLGPSGPAGASSFHYVRQIAAPPGPYIAHPYTLLQASEVVGRQRELNALTDWAADAAGSRVMVFVAIGGMGKSAVTWKWFNEIAPHEMRPLAGRVWWSFYESDAHFDNFVTRTLAYITGRSLDQVAEIPRADQEDELLEALDRDPYLVVLDGMERLLLAYSRVDAAYAAEDDLDAYTANSALSALGSHVRIGAISDESRLRKTADPRTGRFLQRLATIRTSRVLATSRLYPTDLETFTGEPVHGVIMHSVDGLSDDDAVNLWREFGVTGARDELVALFNTFGNYPLLIRALAGAVARFRPAPADFHRWRQTHTGFDPFRLPLVQRKSHVLEYALGGLSRAEREVLYTTAAFRSPATYDTLAALLVGDDKVCSDDAALDRVLSVLEDRGLLGWDKRGNRYDLHPVVRGVVWAALDPGAQQGIYQRLASHFQALPPADDESIKSIDDLTGAIELYHTLVRLHRAEEAFEILDDRIVDPVLETLGTYREVAELIELFIEEPGLAAEVSTHESRTWEDLITTLCIFYLAAGDPNRALDTYHQLMAEDFTADEDSSFEAIMLCALGKLAEAELAARLGFNSARSPEENHILPLATVLIRRGRYIDGRAWLSDYRLDVANDISVSIFGAPDLLELGMTSLRHGRIADAQAFCDRIFERGRDFPLATIHAMSLSGALSTARGQHERAYEQLNDALVVSRRVKNLDCEIGVLTQLAELNATMGRLGEARKHSADALQLAEHGELRLRQADAMNVLSRIEHLAGNRDTAASAAIEAYRLAWCDGPPFSYDWGIRQARQNLAAVNEPEPTDLDVYTPIEMPELKSAPMPRNAQ
jgi:tetratricopeptide (TPR) repeat protein